MKIRPMFLATAVVVLAIPFPVGAVESLLPAEPVPLDPLADFKPAGSNWVLAGSIGGDPRREATLVPTPGSGIVVNTAPNADGSNLFTAWEHGDMDLELDFLMPAGSNSGIYLAGRYEVQLFDSWGVTQPTFADCGGIYQRWIHAENRGYEGTAPLVNACRAPGLWQHLRIVFRAPRFDASGKKTENARFLEVVLNGSTIHQNVEVTGPTRAAAFGDEKPRGPLLIQGNHGPVALRNLSVKHYTDAVVTLSDLTCEIRRGEKLVIGDDKPAPDSTPIVTEVNPVGLGVPNYFIATYNGNIHVPAAGTYVFHATAAGPVRLLVAGETALAPLTPGARSNPLILTAGAHRFRLDYSHGQWDAVRMKLEVEGPGLRMQSLTPEPKKEIKMKPQGELLIEPEDGRVRVQRCFTPFEPRKRPYSIGIGSPAGVHFAYDFDTAAILRGWSGSFLNMFEMWDGRGHNQIAKPNGPALTLGNKPAVALLETANHDWPDEPDAQWSSEGYILEPDGQPVFHARLAGLTISDRIAAAASPRRLERTLHITGAQTLWKTGALLAEADLITPQPGGEGYIVGDRGYYIDVATTGNQAPLVRKINGHDQLYVLVPATATDFTLVYSLVW